MDEGQTPAVCGRHPPFPKGGRVGRGFVGDAALGVPSPITHRPKIQDAEGGVPYARWCKVGRRSENKDPDAHQCAACIAFSKSSSDLARTKTLTRTNVRQQNEPQGVLM
jgi:hypothetical protein